MIFCDFNRKDPKEKVEKLFADFAERVKCPVYCGYPFGHVPESYLVDFSMTMAITPEDRLVRK